MSTWEERMATRAAKRERDRQAVAEAAQAAKRAAYEAELREAARAEFEAGPPDGCTVCYIWVPCYWPGSPGYRWSHFTIEDGDCTCRHGCHDEPYWCGLVALAAS